METLTRLVTESLARHGIDRPLDDRRLQWSRRSRCESYHRLLVVPGKPGVFAPAEEVINLESSKAQVEPAASPGPSAAERVVPRSRSEEKESGSIAGDRRMPAVGQFFEDGDMAFVLDRMLSHENPMRSGKDRRTTTAPRLNSAIATTIHCSSSFLSGF